MLTSAALPSCQTLSQAFDYWLKVPKEKREEVADITQMLHNASLLYVTREGVGQVREQGGGAGQGGGGADQGARGQRRVSAHLLTMPGWMISKTTPN